MINPSEEYHTEHTVINLIVSQLDNTASNTCHVIVACICVMHSYVAGMIWINSPGY